MDKVAHVMSYFSEISIERLIALLALAAIGLAVFSIYVVFSVVKGQRS